MLVIVEKLYHQERTPGASDEKTFMAVAVAMMSNMQRKQDAESNAIIKFVAGKVRT